METKEQANDPMATNMAKLFVGGLKRETTAAMLKNYFSKYGQVEEALIIFDRLTGNSRGFGFITFQDSSMANKVFLDEHIIHGKKVDVKPATPKGQCISKYQQRDESAKCNNTEDDSGIEIRTKKIFVGGLQSDTTEEEFKDYFKEFGTITSVVVMYDKRTGQPRNFGFITFESEECVENVLKNRFHKLKEKFVEVKRAKPKEKYPHQLDYGAQPYCIHPNMFYAYWDFFNGSYYFYPRVLLNALVDFRNYLYDGYRHPATYVNGWDSANYAPEDDPILLLDNGSQNRENLNGQS